MSLFLYVLAARFADERRYDGSIVFGFAGFERLGIFEKRKKRKEKRRKKQTISI